MMQVEVYQTSPADTESPNLPSGAAASVIAQSRPQSSSAQATWSNSSSFHPSPEDIDNRRMDLHPVATPAVATATAAVPAESIPEGGFNDDNIEFISTYTAFGVAPVSGMTRPLRPHIEDLLDDDSPMISGPASMMDSKYEKVPRMTTDTTVFDDAAYLQDVFYPGWPRDLPGPIMMDQM